MTTPRLAAATRTAADENFYETAGTSGAVGHWCTWNELDDPLSSFVPETLSPAPGGVFLSAERPRSAAEPRLVVRRARPSSGYRGEPWSASSRMAGVEGRWSLQFFLFRHHRGAPPALLTAPDETLLRDVVLARPAVFAGLTYEGLPANGLRHGLALVGSVHARSRLVSRRTCAPSYPGRAATDRASDHERTSFGGRRLRGAIPSIDTL